MPGPSTSASRRTAAIWEDNSCDELGQCAFLNRQGICRNGFGAGTWARCNLIEYGLLVECPKQWPCHVTI